MPAAVGAFIAKVGFLVISGMTAVGIPFAAAVTILDYALKFAALQFLGWVSEKLSGVPDFAESVRGTQVVVRGTIEHQRIVIGETLVSGLLQYINTSGVNNNLLHESIVLAGHECEDITDVWFDDTKIEEAWINWAGDGAVMVGSYRGSPAGSAVKFEKHLGTDNQPASQMLRQNFAEVTSAHQGRGMTYCVVQMNYGEGTEDTWERGEPTDIKFLVKGWKMYDPRSDSTQPFGTGPLRVNSPPTWRWSKNPALAWARYMIDEDLGFGEDPQWIDWGYVASAANICDGVVFTPAGTSARYECNGVLSTASTHEDNIQAILSSFNGSMAEVNGVFKLRAYAYDTPTLAPFTDDYLRDDIQISLDEEPDTRFNTVRGVFVDKDRQYKAMPFPPFTSSEYLARDNGERLYHDIRLPMTTDVFMAQRLAAGILEQGNLMTKVVYPSNFKTLPAEVNGTVYLDHEDMGWNNQPFRVERYVLRDMDGVDLILKIDDPDAYVDVGTAEYSVYSAGVYTTPSPGVPAPSSLWTESITDGVIIRWTPPPARLYETTRIYWSTNNSRDQAIQIADVRGAEFMHRTERPQPGYYWARTVNYANALSDFYPGSGQSGVVGVPNKSGTYVDYSFDFSSDLAAFWDQVLDTTPINSGFIYRDASTGVVVGSAAIVSSGSIGGSSVLRVTHIGSGAGGPLSFNTFFMAEKAVRKIIGDMTEVRVTARVASAGGMVDSRDAIIIGMIGWGAAPNIDVGGAGGGGSGKPQPLVSSWTVLGQSEKRVPFKPGAADYTFKFNNSSLTLIGAKFFSIKFGMVFKGEANYVVDVDQMSAGWGTKIQDGYSVNEIAGTINSGRLSLNYDDGNAVFHRVGANVTSITISGWPASGTLGELAITFQRSGSSTAVVATTAWPSGVRWNGGQRFVLTSNSGGYGRVLLSTRDGGVTILADKADGYS